MRRSALLLAIMLPPLAAASAAQAPPRDLTNVGVTQRLGARLPLAAAFRDESGRDVTLEDAIGGRPALLLFGYFHCSKLCSVLRAETLAGLDGAGLVADRDYRLLAISIDPHETNADAAQAKARDLESFPAEGAQTGWRYLTGAPEQIADVTRAAGFNYDYSAEGAEFAHPIGRVFVSAKGLVAAYLLGFGVDASALRSAIGRAAAEKTAPPAAPAMLLCFDYDPTTGRYTPAIMKLLRLLSVAAVATLAGIVFLMRRRPGPA